MLDVLAAKYAPVTVLVTWWSVAFSLTAVNVSVVKFWLSGTNVLASPCVSMAVDGLKLLYVLVMPGLSWMAAMSATTNESSAAANVVLVACVLMVAEFVATHWSTATVELVVAVSVAKNGCTDSCELIVKDMSLTFSVLCVSVGTAVLLMVMGSVAANFRLLS